MRSLALAGLAVFFFVAPIALADEPTARSDTSLGTTKPHDSVRQPDRSIARRYREILAEFEADQARLRAEYEARKAGAQRPPVPAANQGERPRDPKAVAKGRPRDSIVDTSRRLVDLAESSPDDPAARDALLWVINQPGRGDMGPYGDQFARAAALLVRHHGDDPEAVRIGLRLDNVLNPYRDALLLRFYAAAKGHEAKGLARLALAQYLAEKAKYVVYARSVEGRPKRRIIQCGKVVREIDLPDEQYAYLLELRQCDPQIVHDEAKRLFEEVIAEYGDVPHITHHQRNLEALLREPAPKRNGRSLTAEDLRKIAASLERKKTLGQEAEARLDEMLNLVVGKPAPEIQGMDVDGKHLKLSDFRGKAVMLVFWGSWCGPCMQQMPYERELAEKYKDRPFTMLGVVCGDGREKARTTMEKERITWPNWCDGERTGGPIASLYQIRGYPSTFVIDAHGIIRSLGYARDGIEAMIETLVKEAEASGRSDARTSAATRRPR